MIFTQYYLDCLSHASYLIGDSTTGQAVIVDPRRDVREYLDDAAAQNLTIVGVINTHFHADFAAGHLELAAATGAWIGYGEAAEAEFDVRKLADGERISLGEVTLEIMSTPGHTPESISVCVEDVSAQVHPYAVLTGDTLFIGDVGRPDLLASVGVTSQQLGAMLYDSVHNKLMRLPDETVVFPAHGAGSACGKNLSTEKQSTIGEQRRTNYACAPMSESEFVALVTAGQPSAPGYFAYDAALNKQDHPILNINATVEPLSDEQVQAALSRGAKIHDGRTTTEHLARHLRGSYNVPTDGRMAETVGMVFAPSDEIIVLAPAGEEHETAIRFSRIGFDGVLGFIEEPDAYMDRHPERCASAERVQPASLNQYVAEHNAYLLDVRNPGEVEAGVIADATVISLAQLPQRFEELDPERPVVAYCAGGWRSAVAASFLRARGFVHVSDVEGGYNAWAEHHLTSV